MQKVIWKSINGLPKRSESFVLAKTKDGRIMVFRASILVNAMRKDTPNHLQFPATHFISVSDLLKLPNEE